MPEAAFLASAECTQRSCPHVYSNVDGKVDVADIVEIVNYLNNKTSERFNMDAADANGDKVVDIKDIQFIEDIIMGKE